MTSPIGGTASAVLPPLTFPAIKNCGLRDAAICDVAIAEGAAFLGFVHYPPSPRHLSLADMASLVAHVRGRVRSVAVLVNPDDALLESLVRDVAPDYLQIHKATPERLTAIHARFSLPVIAGISIRTAEDVANLPAYEAVCDHLLLDAAQAGSGHAFDWGLLADATLHTPWFLAGGLSPENVADALRITRAPMVDVSSGIEAKAGEKSAEKIAAFNGAVLGCATV